jgi:hypothetical protein
LEDYDDFKMTLRIETVLEEGFIARGNAERQSELNKIR